MSTFETVAVEVGTQNKATLDSTPKGREGRSHVYDSGERIRSKGNSQCPDHAGEWLGVGAAARKPGSGWGLRLAGAGQTGELTQALPTLCKGSHDSEQRRDMSRLVF